MSEILDKFYTAEGEEPTEEEEALLAEPQQAMTQGPPPGLAQVLAQAQQGGQ